MNEGRALSRRAPLFSMTSPFDTCAWCAIEGCLVFLDLSQDRYFRLTDDANAAALEALQEHGAARRGQPSSLPPPTGWRPANRAAEAIATGPFRVADVARALWMQKRVERQLAQRSFEAVLTDLHTTLRRAPKRRARSGEATIRAFEHARLLRTAADRCLPRSIALALCLAANGVRSHIVIGVKIAPFGAHCWAQAGDTILNDTVEEVSRYAPILVI